MFVVSDRPTFTHSVETRVPTDGGFEIQIFKATFRVMTTEEVQQYDLNDPAQSAEFLRAVIEDMGSLQKPDKSDLPYSDAVRDQVLSMPYARAALARTYFSAVGGATLGN